MQAYRINVELNESFYICCEIVYPPTFDLSGLSIVWIIKSLLGLI
jgi:hypothetical protein